MLMVSVGEDSNDEEDEHPSSVHSGDDTYVKEGEHPSLVNSVDDEHPSSVHLDDDNGDVVDEPEQPTPAPVVTLSNVVANDHTHINSLEENAENDDTQINSLEHVLDTEDSKEFLVDSGSTKHVVNEDDGFINYDESFKPGDHCVELADGTKTWGVAKKKGDMLVKVRNSDGDVVDITLNDVLYMPSYPQNVFSVKAAVRKSNARVGFENDKSAIYAPDGTQFPMHEKNSLYYRCAKSELSVNVLVI